MFTLANDPVLRHHFVLAQVCVTIDAVTGLDSLGRHPVATRQMLAVEGVGPVALNGVQHIVHRPEHLSGPHAPGSRLVIIAQGLDMGAVRHSFDVFMSLDRREPAP